MAFVWAVVVLLAGCRSDPGDNPLVGTRWRLIALERDGQAMPIPTDIMPVLTFHDEMRVVFRAGCTGGVGSGYDFFPPDDNLVAVIRPIGCQNGRIESWDLEVAFSEFTTEAESHEVIGDELIVHAPGGEMRFRRLSAADEATMEAMAAAVYTPPPPTPAPVTPTPAPKARPTPPRWLSLPGWTPTLRRFRSICWPIPPAGSSSAASTWNTPPPTVLARRAASSCCT